MFRNAFNSILLALKKLVRGRQAMIALLAVFAALLASIYTFMRVREATISQLVFTFTLLLAIPVLFFVWQSVSINYVKSDEDSRWLPHSIYRCWKLAIVTVPAVAIVVALWFVLDKLQLRFGIGPGANGVVQHSKWWTVFTATRFALVGVVGPLMIIRLWIASLQSGLLSIPRHLRQFVAGTFSSESILIYVAGSVFFLVIPYFVINKPVSTQKAWLEFTILGVRLVISALLVVVGWATTVGALTVAGSRRHEVTSAS